MTNNSTILKNNRANVFERTLSLNYSHHYKDGPSLTIINEYDISDNELFNYDIMEVDFIIHDNKYEVYQYVIPNDDVEYVLNFIDKFDEKDKAISFAKQQYILHNTFESLDVQFRTIEIEYEYKLQQYDEGKEFIIIINNHEFMAYSLNSADLWENIAK